MVLEVAIAADAVAMDLAGARSGGRLRRGRANVA
jgi:hypothetical protein